jgi:ubiquinone/menaquinone biosynthesis C-methylase UbiE/uncharacterized protein YbaR (Trm112 family)
MTPSDYFVLLCCPACKGDLERNADSTEMNCPRCAFHFPIVDGIPVLFPLNVKEKMPELFHRYWDSVQKAQAYDTQVEGIDIFGKYNHESELYGLLRCVDLENTRLLLDVGSGNGRFEEAFPAHITAVAADASLNLLRIAKQRGRGQFHVCCELEHLPFRDDQFDTVISCRVLQHLRAQEKAVGELSRVTRSGGSVVLELYNKWNLKTVYKNIRMSRLGKVLNWPFRKVFRSLSPFDDWGLTYDRYNSWLELHRWLRRCGMVRIRGRGVGFGYHKYLFDPFFIDAIMEKRAPKLLKKYYNACFSAEKLVGSWVPFVYVMEKFVIAATKPDAVPTRDVVPERTHTVSGGAS